MLLLLMRNIYCDNKRKLLANDKEERSTKGKLDIICLTNRNKLDILLRNGTIESPDSDAWGYSNQEGNGFSCALPIFSALFSHLYIGYGCSHLRLSRHNEPDGSYARGVPGVFR